MGRAQLSLLLLALAACGGTKSPQAAPQPTAEQRLQGTWQSRGEDAVLGPVEVFLSLEAGGVLGVVLVLEGGGRRRFPGTWALEGEELVLRGAYFEPGGESRVRWHLSADGALVLEDGTGRTQRWARVAQKSPPAHSVRRRAPEDFPLA